MMVVGGLVVIVRWWLMGPVSWGVGSIAWLVWGALQCALAPAHAFILLSSYPAHGRQFEIGTLYKYVYETSVLLNEPQANPVSTPKDVGFKIELNVVLAPVWSHPNDNSEQLIQLGIVKPSLSVKARQGPTPEGFAKKASRIDSYTLNPMFIHWKNGLVKHVYRVDDDQLTMVNVKKGIASLLQYQLKDITKSEVDTSGRCEVTYKVIDKTYVSKTKRKCNPVPGVRFHNNTNMVLGANIESQAAITYEFSNKDRVIRAVTGVETHFLRIQARLESGSEVISKQQLQMKGSSKGTNTKYSGKTVKEAMKSISSKLKKKFTAEALSTIPDPKECIACKSLKDLINNFRNALSGSSLASQSSAIAFIRILHKVRETDQETIQKILKNKKITKILPQLLDIVAAAQTIPSHKAAMSMLNFNEESNIALPERYLLALSLSTHPSEYMIQDLMQLVKNKMKSNKLYETLVLTLASLANTYRTSFGKNTDIVDEITNHLIEQLKGCKNENCNLMYIRAFKNLRDKNSLAILLKFIEGDARKPAIYAMRAVQTMPPGYIDEKVCRQLEKVFLELDRPHDSTVRSLAANVLLQHEPSEEFLRALFDSLSSQKLKELNTLVLGQIRDIISTNEKTRKVVDQILKSPRYSNYHILGQNGLSTAFSRDIAQDKDANSSFTNILEISGGLLKRSTVDVFVDSKDAKMRLLSFEIFAGGLNMFGGDDDTSQEGGEEANAGIEITLMDTQLRPYVFFTGQGELMGHVWSGTGSERTTALQGSVLLQDHNQYVPLQNGLTIEMILTGVISYDFAGQVEISLWNRNAHSLVEVAAAVVVQGQARVDNSVVQTMIEFNTGAQSQLNFVSDLDFSDDIMMCLQMIQPDFEIIENVRKLEKIPGSKYVLRKYKRKVIPSAGKTYVMNRKNTELCNKMFR